jgi:ribosomal protein L29
VSKLSEARRRVSGLDMADAQEELRTLRTQLFHLRLQHARGEVKNNRQFQQIRADIARLMFRLGELNREARRGVAPEPEEAAQQPPATVSPEPAADE